MFERYLEVLECLFNGTKRLYSGGLTDMDVSDYFSAIVLQLQFIGLVLLGIAVILAIFGGFAKAACFIYIHITRKLFANLQREIYCRSLNSFMNWREDAHRLSEFIKPEKLKKIDEDFLEFKTKYHLNEKDTCDCVSRYRSLRDRYYCYRGLCFLVYISLYTYLVAPLAVSLFANISTDLGLVLIVSYGLVVILTYGSILILKPGWRDIFDEDDSWHYIFSVVSKAKRKANQRILNKK